MKIYSQFYLGEQKNKEIKKLIKFCMKKKVVMLYSKS